MYARVPHAMEQFVVKIAKLSHIMRTTPMLEMSLAYGLRPQLWVLIKSRTGKLMLAIIKSLEDFLGFKRNYSKVSQ